MAKNITQYDLLISCPSDVKDEIKIIYDVIEQFNIQFSDTLKIRINPKHWSKNSYNESGGKPQQLLNKQFIEDCDAAVAIFWTRFGSATENYDSGTEEEIEEMLKSDKQVFMYFSEKPIPPSNLDNENYMKVQEFKNRYKDKGLYYIYNSNDEFKEKLFAHITQHFIVQEKKDEILSSYKSNLLLKSISDNKLTSNLAIHDFKIDNRPTFEEIKLNVINLYNKISKYNFDNITNNLHQSYQLLQSKVTINDKMKSDIILIANEFKINIDDDFFNLGNLSEDKIKWNLFNKTFIGNENEKSKYYDIIKLYNLINDLYKWYSFEDNYYKLKCIKLAVVNEGTSIDEDVDIKLYIDKNMIIKIDDLPVLDDFTIAHITTDYQLDELFGIEKTNLYNDYNSSNTQLHIYNKIPSASYDYLTYKNKNYQEEYMESLHNIFDYDFFEEDNYIILNLHVDYIKHNTAVAFPSVLFVTDQIKEIKYKITSKLNGKIVDSTLTIE